MAPCHLRQRRQRRAVRLVEPVAHHDLRPRRVARRADGNRRVVGPKERVAENLLRVRVHIVHKRPVRAVPVDGAAVVGRRARAVGVGPVGVEAVAGVALRIGRRRRRLEGVQRRAALGRRDERAVGAECSRGRAAAAAGPAGARRRRRRWRPHWRVVGRPRRPRRTIDGGRVRARRSSRRRRRRVKLLTRVLAAAHAVGGHLHVVVRGLDPVVLAVLALGVRGQARHVVAAAQPQPTCLLAPGRLHVAVGVAVDLEAVVEDAALVRRGVFALGIRRRPSATGARSARPAGRPG